MNLFTNIRIFIVLACAYCVPMYLRSEQYIYPANDVKRGQVF